MELFNVEPNGVLTHTNQVQQDEFRIESESDIVMARQVVWRRGYEFGLWHYRCDPSSPQHRELTRKHLSEHAKSGVMHWRLLNCGTGVGPELVFEDHGPGISI